MTLSIKPNRFYPAVPSPGQDLASLQSTVELMRTAMLTFQRSDANYPKSFVRFEELVDLGIVDIEGNNTLTTGGGGGENQTPWLSNIDGAGFALQNALSVEIQSADTNYFTTLGFNGNDFQILMDAAGSPQNLRVTGFVGGDFVVEGTAGGGRIRQENAADSSEYIEMYHDTANTARIIASGGILLESTSIPLPYVDVSADNAFRKLGPSIKATSFDWVGADFVIDGDGSVGASAVDFKIINFTNDFVVQNYAFSANQALTVAEDNYVLTYDFALGTIQLEPGGGGGPTSDHPHTGEVTGTTALTGQVSLITNRVAVSEVSESGVDELPLHDATDGSFKKTPVNLVTDGGYF